MIPLKFKNVKHLLVTVFSITNSRFKSFDSYKNGLQMSVIYRLHKKRLQIIATFSWFRYFSSPEKPPTEPIHLWIQILLCTITTIHFY